jgi:hypothetical protein
MAEISLLARRRPPALLLALLTVALAALTFAQVFLTFRGLSSPLGMEQAGLARELARGRGFQTKMVEPFAWKQFLNHDKKAVPGALPDTFDPPLQPLVLAPLFKAMESQWAMNTNRNVYLMDRVVACVSVVFFLAACGVTWSTARRLFDAKIAGWTVVAALLCGLLWDVARSGLPQMMALFFFSVGLWAFARGLERVQDEHSAMGDALVMGLMGAFLSLTHWMGICLALGLAAAALWMLRPRVLAALLVAAIPLFALAGWGLRNHAVCGHFFGANKPLLLAGFSPSSESWLLRDFSGTSPMALAGIFGRKLVFNASAQLHDVWQHFGGALPALLFFVALLHPFKKEEVRGFGRGLAVVWLFAMVGMLVVGLPRQQDDANQMHVLFIPAMSMFGFALLMVLWTRLGMKTPYGGWWSEHGAPLLATALSAVPLLTSLFTELTPGLSNKGQFAHWPPYLPGQIARLASFTGERELIMSDIPWAVAWYADRPSAWIPQEKVQFAEMRQLAEKAKTPVVGFLFTPESLRVDRPADVFGGEYQDWAAEAFRGVAFGFGVDLIGHSDFPFREFLPLSRTPSGGRVIVEMLYMSDKKRWEQSMSPVAASGASTRTSAP